MLSFDIETTGISYNSSHETLACTYDGDQCNTYHLWKPVNEGCTCTPDILRGMDGKARALRCVACRAWHAENAHRLFHALDNAQHICGYNCIRFDIPYLQNAYSIDGARVRTWIAKCVDPFFYMSESLGMYCKLDAILRFNGMDTKAGNGRAAVDMAFNAEWDKLEHYCAKDAKLTWELVNADALKIPVHTIEGITAMEIKWAFTWRAVGEGGDVESHPPSIMVPIPIQSVIGCQWSSITPLPKKRRVLPTKMFKPLKTASLFD